ncbi:peptidoglycan-binding protein [Kitasatospora hibisci]|uniref:peptidoglycan-binding domain-containing protein n=1 Tax=Kitasatospora hibisci TaxID=3369522 RepID=UPI003754139D
MRRPPVASLADAELAGLLDVATMAPRAARELMHRHGGAVLAHALRLGADPDRAGQWAAAAFNLVLDAVRSGHGPDGSWAPHLGEAMLQVAHARAVAVTAPEPRDAPPRPRPHRRRIPDDGARTAPSLLPRAFRQLPEPWQTELRHELSGGGGPSKPTTQSTALKKLRSTYLRVHTAQLDDRSCRHLTVRLDDLTRGRGPVPSDLRQHLRRCPHCLRASDDLRLLRGHLPEALLQRLVGGETPQLPTGPPATDTGPGPGPAPRTHRFSEHAGHPTGTTRWRPRAVAAGAGLSLAALCAGLVALAGPPTGRTGGDAMRPGPVTTAPGPNPPSEPATRPPSSAPASPSPAVPTAPSAPSRRPRPSPSKSSGTGRPEAPNGPAAPVAPAPAPTVPVTGPAPSSPATPSPGVPVPGTPTTTPSTTAPSPRSLRLGDHGPEIRRLQELLAAASCRRFPPAFFTGIFDLRTQDALTGFQDSTRIRGEERGLYGPRTRAALEGRARAAHC